MTRNKFTKTFLSISFAILLPLICFFALGITNPTKAKGDSELKYYSEFESITNASFDSISSTYASNNVSGWNLVKGNTKATTMIIDTEKNYSTNSSNPYYISTIENPGTKDTDNKILMINSANKNNNPSSKDYKPTSANEGYKSSDITLTKNSYYVLQASFKTNSFSQNANTFASIYVSGLKNDLGEDVKLEYEMISSNIYQTVYFFIATGSEDQKANLELWLGSEEYESFGVVFFDAVYLQKCSENIFYENYYTDFYSKNNYLENVNYSNLDKNGYEYNYYASNETYNNSNRPLVSMCELSEVKNGYLDYNLDFEKDNSASLSGFIDWKLESQTQYADAKVININSSDSFKLAVGKNYEYTGTNFKYSNDNALLLWTTEGESGNVNVVSKDIKIKAHECLKFSAMVKVSELVSGSFNFTVKENDAILNNFSSLKDLYTLNSKSVSVSSSGNDNYANKYTNVEIYIQGHDLYDSSLNIVLSLGSESTLAEGCVVVDNVNIENVSFEEYTKATNSLKLNTVTADQKTLSVPNGYFNTANSSTDNISYPLVASEWTTEQDSKVDVVSGVINTYNKYFEELEKTYDWATLENPAKNSNVSNNVYMMHNPNESYQAITSAELSLAKDSYYALTLDYKTIKAAVNVDADLTVEIISNDFLIYSATISSNTWYTHTAYLHTDSATTVKAKLSFGKANKQCQGYVFIDNVELNTVSQEVFEAASNQTDLRNFMYNIDPTHSIGNNSIPASAFTESGSFGKTGLIIGKNNAIHDIDDGTLNNNVILLETIAPTTISLTSKKAMTLEANGYYKLTFRLLTKGIPGFSSEEEDNQYGVKVNLSNFEEKSFLLSNNEWNEYTLYFHNESEESIDSNLVLSLTSQTQVNTGYAFITDIVWTEKDANEESLESEFTNAESEKEFNKTIFTNSYIASTDEENPETDTDSDTTTDAKENSNDGLITALYAFSAVITGVAIVVAIVGICLKRVRLKKNKKVKNADYDKKIEIDQKIVTNEAERVKNAEQTQIEKEMEVLKAEILKIEDEQKARINLSRSQNGKITKDIEREFKAYANKRTKLQDKLNMLNERLANINTPEYLISLERRISTQMLREKKEAHKLAKKNK